MKKNDILPLNPKISLNLNAFGQGGNKKQKEKMAKMETVIIFKFLKFFFSIAKFRLSMETIETVQYAHLLLRQILLKCKKVQFFFKSIKLYIL